MAALGKKKQQQNAKRSVFFFKKKSTENLSRKAENYSTKTKEQQTCEGSHASIHVTCVNLDSCVTRSAIAHQKEK